MRVLKGWEQFIIKFFDYIIDLELDVITSLGAIASSPGIRIPNIRMKIEMEKFKKRANVIGDESYVIAMNFLIMAFEAYTTNRKLLRDKSGLFDMLIETCLLDHTKNKYTKEEINHNFDATTEECWAPDWYIIKLVKQGKTEELKEFVKLETEVAEYAQPAEPSSLIGQNAMAHLILDEFFWLPETSKSNLRDKLLENSINVDTEELARMMKWDITSSPYIPSAKSLEFVKGLIGTLIESMRYRERSEKAHAANQETIDKTVEKYRDALKYFNDEFDNYHSENLALRKTIDKLKEKINPNKDKEQDKSFQLSMDLEEAKAQIDKLKQERDYLKELLDRFSDEENEIPSAIVNNFKGEIAYFGLQNKQLEIMLLSEGIELKYYSPTNPEDVSLSVPVFFNINIASHTVWNKIKKYRPFVIHETNHERIFSKILEALNTH
jgi:hypothetical protein